MKTSSEDKPSTWHETQIKSFQMLRSTRPATAKSHTTHCNAGIDIIGDSESTLASGIAPRTPHDTATRSGQATAFGGLKGKQRKKVGWALAASGVQAFNLHLADLKVAQAHPNAEQEAGDIKDLCSVLRLTRQQPDKFLLGQFTHDQDRYEVVSVSQQYNADNSTSTFHGLLVNHNHRTPAPGSSASPIATSTSASPPRLTKKARLKLAVILASTVLQLHTTPWLTNDWDGRNIFFRQGSLDCPYVKCACTKLKTPTAKSPEAEWGPIRNRSLFALGVLLLEMSLKSPLEHLKSSKQHQQPQQQHNDFDDFIAASQLVKDVADEEGKGSGYYDAVQACIYGNFGPKVKDLDLANDTFRQAVYEDVILPLERDLEYFCRGP
ncbi:MAG: hypothetical protein L6R39_004086 [Caloplaca ligustica]|nr:MAG: hypothetical protein L6R39_004086 [Caloplaca ligustica]